MKVAPHYCTATALTAAQWASIRYKYLPREGGDKSHAQAHPALSRRALRASNLRLSLRGDLHLGSCSTDVGVDMALERHEVVLEHGDQAAGGFVELRFVLPSLVWVEQ